LGDNFFEKGVIDFLKGSWAWWETVARVEKWRFYWSFGVGFLV
jgi:hypothetical protein